jgi:hypothetical protein
MYTPIALLVALASIPIILYLFTQHPPQRAVIIGFIGAWLFVPVVSFPLPSIPDISKMNVTCYGILLATVIYDAGRITSFKLGWLDLPMLIWCLSPMASSITNDLGAYDGFSASLDQIMTWGVPYFLGRIYLGNLAGMRQLAITIFISGLIYAPLCLYEVRTSPQLHRMVYGYFPGGIAYFLQSIRSGGYRPMVFMSQGLMVGAWMMAATLIGIWLWKTGTLKQVWNIPINVLVMLLLVTLVLCKSTGAYFLLLVGVLVLFVSSWIRNALLVFLIMLLISGYLYQGVSGIVPIERVEALSLQLTNPERTQSLIFRLDNEVKLSKKARERMIFGWGGYGRNRIYEYDWKGDLVDVSITDSLWIIAFGMNGLVGLVSITAVMLLPPASLFILRYPASYWSNPKVAPVAALAVALVLYMADCVLNAMTNPVFALISGGIAGLVLEEPKAKPKAKTKTKTKLVASNRLPASRPVVAQPRRN